MRYSLIASFLPTACKCKATCEEAGELNFDMLQVCSGLARLQCTLAFAPRSARNPPPRAELLDAFQPAEGWSGPQLRVHGKASRPDGDEAELLACREAQRTLSARRSAVGAAAISHACQG